MQMKRCLCRRSGLESCLQDDISHNFDFPYTRLNIEQAWKWEMSPMKFFPGTKIDANTAPASWFYLGKISTKS